MSASVPCLAAASLRLSALLDSLTISMYRVRSISSFSTVPFGQTAMSCQSWGLPPSPWARLP